MKPLKLERKHDWMLKLSWVQYKSKKKNITGIAFGFTASSKLACFSMATA